MMHSVAEVPVVQLSLPADDPGRVIAVDRRMRVLREAGTPIICSRLMTDGLQFITR